MNILEYLFYIHIGALILAACGILYADSLVWSWVRRKREMLDSNHLRRAHATMTIALWTKLGSGITMAWPMRDFLFTQPLFLVKMAFVTMLAANSFVVGRLMHLSTTQAFRTLTARQQLPLVISGTISMLGWVGAGLAAMFFF